MSGRDHVVEDSELSSVGDTGGQAYLISSVMECYQDLDRGETGCGWSEREDCTVLLITSPVQEETVFTGQGEGVGGRVSNSEGGQQTASEGCLWGGAEPVWILQKTSFTCVKPRCPVPSAPGDINKQVKLLTSV